MRVKKDFDGVMFEARIRFIESRIEYLADVILAEEIEGEDTSQTKELLEVVISQYNTLIDQSTKEPCMEFNKDRNIGHVAAKLLNIRSAVQESDK